MAFKTFDLKGSGNPPWGCPNYPYKYSKTDLGKFKVSAYSLTDFKSKLLVTIKLAKSPTTLEEGVTLTISPKALLASI